MKREEIEARILREVGKLSASEIISYQQWKTDGRIKSADGIENKYISVYWQIADGVLVKDACANAGAAETSWRKHKGAVEMGLKSLTKYFEGIQPKIDAALAAEPVDDTDTDDMAVEADTLTTETTESEAPATIDLTLGPIKPTASEMNELDMLMADEYANEVSYWKDPEKAARIIEFREAWCAKEQDIEIIPEDVKSENEQNIETLPEAALEANDLEITPAEETAVQEAPATEVQEAPATEAALKAYGKELVPELTEEEEAEQEARKKEADKKRYEKTKQIALSSLGQQASEQTNKTLTALESQQKRSQLDNGLVRFNPASYSKNKIHPVEAKNEPAPVVKPVEPVADADLEVAKPVKPVEEKTVSLAELEAALKELSTVREELETVTAELAATREALEVSQNENQRLSKELEVVTAKLETAQTEN